MWHFIAVIEDDKSSWLYVYGMEDTSIIHRYVASLYWITQTVITVGYGDITAGTVYEQIMAIISMIVGVIFFSLTVSSLSAIIKEKDK
jgi:Ion channel